MAAAAPWLGEAAGPPGEPWAWLAAAEEVPATSGCRRASRVAAEGEASKQVRSVSRLAAFWWRAIGEGANRVPVRHGTGGQWVVS